MPLSLPSGQAPVRSRGPGYLGHMPVIVVGADTTAGLAILDGLHDPARDVRAFVSDEDTGHHLKQRGFKVALGDVSDESHVEAAATACFSAVLITEAAKDERERSFAKSSAEVLESWARAVANCDVTRVIWVSADETPPVAVGESVTVDPELPNYVDRVVELDDAQTINTSP